MRMRSWFLLVVVCGVVGASASPVICLDPGHPSEVGRGTTGKKISELKAAWLVAKELKTLLEKDGMKVVMTKASEGEFVRNRRRAEIANAANADLMLRFHFDAAKDRGFGTYYPDRAGTTQGVTGPSKAVRDASRAMANPFQTAAMGVLKGHLPSRGVKTEQSTAVGARQGALTGSIFSKVPVLLLEMAVLTNAKDEAFVATPRGRTLLAKACLAGVRAALKAAPGRAAAPRRSAAAAPAVPPAPAPR